VLIAHHRARVAARDIKAAAASGGGIPSVVQLCTAEIEATALDTANIYIDVQ